MSNKAMKRSNAAVRAQQAYVIPEEPRAVRVIGVIELNNGRTKTRRIKPKVEKARKPRVVKVTPAFTPEFTLIKGAA